MPLAFRKSAAASGQASPVTSLPILRLGQGGATEAAVLTVPGTEVPLLPLELPPGLRGQAREQVARRQLADRTGLAATSLELRPFLPERSKRAGPAWTRVLAGDSQYLQGLQDLTCRAVLPDYLTLPTAAGLWCLKPDEIPATPPGADAGEGAVPHPLLIARLGPEDGFAARPPLALAMLRQALAAEHPDSPPPRAILWLGACEGPLWGEVSALAQSHDIALIQRAEEAAALDLSPPQVLAHGELACDLRHNPLAARARLSASLRPWRWPLLAGCLAAGLWAAGEMLQLSRLEAAIQAQSSRNQALVKAHFVPEGPVLDARLQVSRALTQLRQASAGASAQTDPLALTARLSAVLTRGGAQAGLHPELLSYQAGEGLLLALRLQDFAAADQLLEDLRQAGLRSDLSDARVNEAESGVRAEFVITGFAAEAPAPPASEGQP